MRVRIGSRESKLAVIQSEMVIKAINEFDKNIETELITMKTTGDKILDKTLDKIGGKGLFVKELDKALISDEVDLTVHSLKDMPMEVPEELPLLAFSKREDPRDVLILPKGVDYIDYSKPIGCSSLRRQLQIKEIFPEAEVAPVRGNVQTRLAKLDDGQFSGLVLAYAGIKRLGLEERVSRVFEVNEILPACCQGILAVQGRAGYDAHFLKDFDDEEARFCQAAERSYVKTLDGGCSSPVAAYATVEGEYINITGFYVDDNNNTFTQTIKGPKDAGVKLGRLLALEMKGVK